MTPELQGFRIMHREEYAFRRTKPNRRTNGRGGIP
jgi:hypothetical protein